MSLHTAGLQASSIHVHPYTGVLTGRKRVRTWCYVWGWEVHDADAPQEAFNEFFMCVGFFVCGLQEGAACVCTWPTALLKLRSLDIEKEREV